MRYASLALVLGLMACAEATPAPVTLPPTSNGPVSAPKAPARTRAYANERLICALPGSPCIYFIEDRTRLEAAAIGGDVPHQELWLHRPGALDRLLVESHPADTCEARLVDLHSPMFTPDGAHLFVDADCAAVAPSVREIDLGGGGARFLSDGILASIDTRSPTLHVIVKRYLLDLDHAPGDPAYGGRLGYLFDVDVATRSSTRVAGPVD